MNEAVTYYVVSELQVDNGAPVVLSNVFSDRGEALNKYYTILAYAAISKIMVHGAYLNSSSNESMSEIFDRRNPIEFD